MFGSLFQNLVAALVWVVANVVYLDMKRKGIHGFTRFAAFWAGTPTTWVTFFAIEEGRPPTFEAPPDDDESRLLAEIRRDRAHRGDGPRPVGEARSDERTHRAEAGARAGRDRAGDES